jgi:hypothetical protein
VYDVIAEEERNVQAALLDSYVLQAVDLCGVCNKEEGPNLSLASHFIGWLWWW